MLQVFLVELIRSTPQVINLVFHTYWKTLTHYRWIILQARNTFDDFLQALRIRQYLRYLLMYKHC